MRERRNMLQQRAGIPVRKHVMSLRKCIRDVCLNTCLPSGVPLIPTCGQVSSLTVGDLGIEPCFPWLSHTGDINIGTLVATGGQLTGLVGS